MTGPRRALSERLPRLARIRSGREIQHILRTGRRQRTAAVDVFTAVSPSGTPRVGVVVPSFGRILVERNRVKRCLREIARRDWLPEARRAGVAWDMLLRARPSAYECQFTSLRAVLKRSFRQHWCTNPIVSRQVSGSGACRKE